MTNKPVTVRITHEFRRQMKRARVSERELAKILETLKLRPDSGVLVPGTGGARKVRFAGRGKGKRGGYRVIAYHVSSLNEDDIYLLDIYAKSDRVDLTQAERNMLRDIVEEISEIHTEA